jgi:two-component system, LuxR family, sensor histidine kinase DctS
MLAVDPPVDPLIGPRSTLEGRWRPLAARRGLWALPMVLSLLFVAGVLVWAQRNDLEEREQQRRNLISDALSAEAQLRARLELETAQLAVLAGELRRTPHSAAALAANPGVEAGLRRLWVSVTWLDADNRIVASVPEGDAALPSAAAQQEERAGLSAHLVADVPSAAGERVIVRYSPALLLKRATPWWLTRRYEVQLVDSAEQVIASADEGLAHQGLPGRQNYRVQVGAGTPGTWLWLTERVVPAPWWRGLPLSLIAGFLALVAVATALLRRQMHQVARAEAAWRTELAWRGAMEDSALVGLRARDSEGRLLYVNRTFCDMVGLPAGQLVGSLPPMPYWPPDSREEAMQRSRRNLAGGAPREGYEARWRRSDGVMIEVMVFESPLVNAVGQQIGWMGSIIDITQKKRLEEREQRQTETLAHQARLTTLGEVASVLAHQLNQPLTAVAGYNAGVLKLLERSGQADPVVLRALRSLGEQATEAGRIVQRIREFLTRRSPQRERSDVATLARRAVGLLQRDLTRHQAQLDWALDPALPAVLADPVLVEQVLINLLRNALDEPLPAGSEGRRLRVAASRSGARFVRVDVEDNGPGLQGRSVEQLTAPFYSTKPEGMGMGLAICRSVIELHHGAFDASTGSLGGARFSFTLPVDAPAIAEPAVPAPSSERPHEP